jgi:hypothetical protein
MATMIVLADMRAAPTAGVIRKPVPKVMPAAMRAVEAEVHCAAPNAAPVYQRAIALIG